MVRFFRDAGRPGRRPREAARRRRRSERDLKLESLEPRLALAVMAGLPDTIAPVVRSVSLPAAGTYGTDRSLTFKVHFSEPVKLAGDQSTVTLPVEVGFAMREARYVSGSGTRSLTFRMTVTANDVDTNGVSIGRVNSVAIRDFDFNKPNVTPRLLDLAGNPASNAIPAIDSSRIRVDATGPVVASYGGFTTRVVQGRQRVSLKVTFDGPVQVAGRPTVPVTIDGQDRSLSYAAGSGTSTLTFTITMPKGVSATKATFRGENGLPGEVILLPANADLTDRYGNSVTAIGSTFGQIYEYQRNRVVVIGTHYEKLDYGSSGRVSQDDLNTIMNDEQKIFRSGDVKLVDDGKASYWEGYEPPVFEPAKNEVDLYRVAYRSTIPEQGYRPTVAYGLVAIPTGATGALPLVSYQHGTLWLKESAPSQAFSWDKNDTTPFAYGLSQKQLYDSCFETRLNVAQFAGRGYAVIAADFFGTGNSIENDSFVVKKSEQQACLDMYAASQKLFEHLSLSTDKLFLNGWSQGALVSLSFQEALEARGVKVDGVSTAATPADAGMFAKQFIFNPRPYSTTTVPNAAWSIFVHQFSSFALASYSGQTDVPLELFGGNYELSRKFYMREFREMPQFMWQDDGRGNMEPVIVMDGVTTNTEVSRFLSESVTRTSAAYERTAYAKLIADAGAGTTRLEGPMRMYYGQQDEGYAVAVCTLIDTWQRGTFGKTNIEQVPVPKASHHATLLTATSGQLEWFDAIRRGMPTPGSGAAASVAPTAPVSPIVPQSPSGQSPPFVLPPAVGGIVEVSESITADTTFRAGTVYVITGEVHVVSRVTLTIEDGVEVRIRNGRGNYLFLTSPALIFDPGSSLVAQTVTFQAANEANEPVQEADNGGIFFCGGTQAATKDNISSWDTQLYPSSFTADRIVANYLGRTDPRAGDGDDNDRDDIDAISVIGAVYQEWNVKAVAINHSGDDGFDLTDASIQMASVQVYDPVEDGLNLTSSVLFLDTVLQVDMTDSTVWDREIFDFETDNGLSSAIWLPQNATTRTTTVDLKGYWDNGRFDDFIDVESADMKPPPDGDRAWYEWVGTLVNSAAHIFAR